MEATQPVEVLGIDAGGTMTDTFFIGPMGHLWLAEPDHAARRA